MLGPSERQLPKRRRRMASVGSGLPEDILSFEILVLLPVKCLVRLQLVCKLWRATITSTHFAHRHLERSRSKFSFLLMPRRDNEDYSYGIKGVSIFSFEPEQLPTKIAPFLMHKGLRMPMFTLPLHCDGLILIPCLFGRIFVCNPATREFVQLPPGSGHISLQCRVAFGFDPSSGKYKVARHFFRSCSETIDAAGKSTVVEHDAGHEVLTLGGDDQESLSWRATVDPPYPIIARTPACLPGFFYWSALHSLTGHGDDKVRSHVILRFNLRDETFTVHPNPPCRGFRSTYDMLCEIGGKLGYIYSNSQRDAEIWLAEDDGKDLAWSLRCRICLPVPRQIRLHCCPSADQDKVFLSVDTSHLFKCNLRDGTLEEIVDMARKMKYADHEGKLFTSGELLVSHYMLRCVESLLRISPSENEQLACTS
ncbi:putative F-box protein At2g02030 isoform X2 [Panicum virgatum]|nr:putative F-box protein At2g02030 isoform X2 [Panicum virgatum]KAG2596462.1 hypothetical protein PVAP13_5KG163300 [Panicum virgatum]KAG2596463.1 hypothetical protein PVAP13_5KG163300 [Panicum virgatum]